MEVTIAELSAAVANLTGGIYHEGHKGNYHEGHEVHEGNLSATESHGLNTDGLNYDNSHVSSVKSSENPCLNNDLRDLRGLRGENKTLAPRPSTLDPRVKLNAPTILSVLGTADSFTLTWSAVPSAYSYTVQYSQDATFSTGAQTGIVNAPLTSYTVGGRKSNKTYYVRVKSYPNLPGNDTASDYSGVQAVRTLLQMPGTAPEGDDSTASQLQNWLDNLESEFGDMTSLVPELGNTWLNTMDRRRLLGSGIKRYGLIEKVVEVSGQFPQFWPPAGEGKSELDEFVSRIDVLRNLLVWLRMATRVVGDLLLIAGNDAFRVSGVYYGTVRENARRRNPDAVQLYQMLRQFWKRPRRNSGSPTQRQLLSHARDVVKGKRDGEFFAKNESDTVTKGRRIAVDKTYPKKRGVNVKETETLDASGVSGCDTAFDVNSMSMDNGK
jgi:hypothetical protein